MQEIKPILTIVAIVLAVIGYIPYFRDILRKKTTPHVYTWFIWGFITLIIFWLQRSFGGGAGSWVSLAVVAISILIFILGMKNGNKDITKVDTIFFVLALASLALWFVAKQPILSAILITSIDMFGFVPTIRKSWNKPYSETLFTYELGAFRHGLTFLALEQYNIMTWLNPISWILANTLFSIILIIRRRQIKQIA